MHVVDRPELGPEDWVWLAGQRSWVAGVDRSEAAEKEVLEPRTCLCHHWAYDEVRGRQRQHLRCVILGRDPAMAVPLVQAVEIHDDDAGHGRTNHYIPTHRADPAPRASSWRCLRSLLRIADRRRALRSTPDVSPRQP